MIAENETAALCFSGGKDSLALLHLARPYLDRITVFFGDTGSVYPHVKKFVIDTCKELGARLVMVTPPMPVIEYTEKHGYPSDLVPTDLAEMAWANPDKKAQRLQSYMNCCGNMIWTPVQSAMKAHGLKIVLRGAKSCDPHVTAPHGFRDADFEYRAPLWDWSDADVMAYLADKNQAHQYPAIMDSMDCWVCTAHMTGQYAGAKLDYAKAHYPNLWPEIARRVKAVRSTVTRERRKINAAFASVT